MGDSAIEKIEVKLILILFHTTGIKKNKVYSGLLSHFVVRFVVGIRKKNLSYSFLFHI